MTDHLFPILFFGRNPQSDTEADVLMGIYHAGLATGAYRQSVPPVDPMKTLQELTEENVARKEFQAFFGRRPATDYGWGEDDDTQELEEPV